MPNQKDAAGRSGVAITYDDPFSHRSNPETGAGDSFIFDPDTYESWASVTPPPRTAGPTTSSRTSTAGP
ncbi:hypothetical protein [Streptomyces avermitilis]|uniref:hypothetical protein n=1 Tax=Streptomyces avermitilis TaxID=33903 RepID=UPI00382567BF